MARIGDKRRKVRRPNLPTEGVITEEMLDGEVEVPDQVTEELVTDNSNTCTKLTGNMVV
ncbi:hypothetical protein CASFOL_009654 [Castilleja foliolosa]|uniref:Uncharacterized protein n=1 Tax=Castilleja foliolosa TaxID=1961234 RepID=A0ABD3DRF9_9LAMI